MKYVISKSSPDFVFVENRYYLHFCSHRYLSWIRSNLLRIQHYHGLLPGRRFDNHHHFADHFASMRHDPCPITTNKKYFNLFNQG